MKPTIEGRAALILVTSIVALSPAAWSDERLADLSLEELSNLEITSVSKRAERLAEAPTSIFVITADDIRRSGATSLAEALRLAPNLEVAQASADEYAISARGFNGSAANKLQVLIDGRSVYTPLFSGVFWDVQDVMLEDVERIEVISGPGGTLWGVNAVDGVINVITRPAARTHGARASVGAGNSEDRGAFRYGGSADNGIDYRIYATHSDLRHTETASGSPVDDAAHLTHLGFRVDYARDRDQATLSGDAYDGRRDQALPGVIATSIATFALGPITTSGENLLGRWEHRLDGGATVSTQAYYDRTLRTVVPTFTDMQDIYDLQLQFSARPLSAHAIVGGLEYRYGLDRVGNSVYVAFLPSRLSQVWAAGFLQDEIALSAALHLTIGARVERNNYSGLAVLPTLRASWQVAPDHLLWMAASRTARAPSRLDHDTFVPGQAPFLLRGGPGVEAETANDYELGYRGRVTSRATLSATVFHADYDQLRTQQIDPTFTYLYFANGMQGSTGGVEIWGTLQATSFWRLDVGFTRLLQDLRLKPGSNDIAAVANAEGANPARWWSLRSSFDLGAHSELDLMLRRTGALAQPAVPAYTGLDVRYGLRFGDALDLSISGRNLLGGGHGEFTDVTTRSQFGRAFFVKLDYRT